MHNTIPAVAPAAVQPDIRAEFNLPSGKHVVIHRGNGRDLRLALMAAGPKADHYRIVFAIIARLATIDGQKIAMESIDTLDFDDAQQLLGEGGESLIPLVKRAKLAQAQMEEATEEPTDND
jgi:hypothetical protein